MSRQDKPSLSQEFKIPDDAWKDLIKRRNDRILDLETELSDKTIIIKRYKDQLSSHAEITKTLKCTFEEKIRLLEDMVGEWQTRVHTSEKMAQSSETLIQELRERCHLLEETHKLEMENFKLQAEYSRSQERLTTSMEDDCQSDHSEETVPGEADSAQVLTPTTTNVCPSDDGDRQV